MKLMEGQGCITINVFRGLIQLGVILLLAKVDLNQLISFRHLERQTKSNHIRTKSVKLIQFVDL